MKVLEVIRDRLGKTSQPPLVLKEAQIIQGKITKIYPQNKAEIQIGTHTLIAEISASLTVGNRYFFEVQGTDDLIHLKVVGEANKANTAPTVQSLLAQLGIKQTKGNTLLMQQLIHNKIPFNQNQIEQAARLLESIGSKPEHIQIIEEMIAQKLPITEATFQALQTQKTNSLGLLLNHIMTDLRQKESLNQTEKTLMQQLENLVVRPVSKGLPMVEQMLFLKPTKETINLFQVMNIIRPEVNSTNLLETMKSMEQTKDATIRAAFTKQAEIMDVQQLRQVLEHLTEKAAVIQKTTMKLMAIFPGLKHDQLTNEQFTLLEKMINTELTPQLPPMVASVLGEMIHTKNQTQLHQVLQFLSQTNVIHSVASSLLPSLENMDVPFVNLPANVQFATHLKNYLDTIGMRDEFNLRQQFEQLPGLSEEATTRQTSVKSLLLQLIGQDNSGIRDSAQSLVHMINGMQMHSVIESGNMMQATIQLPSEKLGLHEDIFLQFEGQKTESGEINPDYCRILFVLDLHHLKEMMIDMHIQKRVIALNVYNDRAGDGIVDDNHLKEVLKEKLSKLNYQLSAVTWKPLHQEVQKDFSGGQESSMRSKQQKERFDFRI